MFSTLHGTCFSFSMHFKMLSAVCFNLDQFKILSSGKVLIHFSHILFVANAFKIGGVKEFCQVVNITTLIKPPFAGESSAGKSSLLNLILGEDLLPSHMLPCTSTITIIKYGHRRCAKIIYKDGKMDTIENLDTEGLQLLQERAYFTQKTDPAKRKEVYERRKKGHDVAEIQVYLPLTLLEVIVFAVFCNTQLLQIYRVVTRSVCTEHAA